MKGVNVVVLLVLLLLIFVQPVAAQGEFPSDLNSWFITVGTIVLALVSGIVAILLQEVLRKLIPYLGEASTAELGKLINRLLGLVLPVAIGLGLIWVMMQFGLEVTNTWAIITALALSQLVGQGGYQVKKSSQ